jgi:hypothetical protein
LTVVKVQSFGVVHRLSLGCSGEGFQAAVKLYPVCSKKRVGTSIWARTEI